MSEENQFLTKENRASEDAINIINKYKNCELSDGEYAHELISETYINLISQVQSGMCLFLENQMLDLKISKPHKISNINSFFNGYRIGKYTINFQQNLPTVTGTYDENANLRITINGLLIEEQIDNLEGSMVNVIYDGPFKNITQEALNILEKCLKFSALNFDLFLDKKLLEKFSKSIKQFDRSLDDLPLLDEKNHKL